MFTTSTLRTILFSLALFAVATPAFADDTDDPRLERRAELLERFDSDGDGRLSGAELEAVRDAGLGPAHGRGPRARALDTDGDGTISHAEIQAAQKRRQRKRLDTDGDGEISDAERAAGRERHAEIVEQYDTDGDGHLSPSERDAAREDGALPGKPRQGKGHAKGRR
jgi:Ca2+-binding EF-hand superfamily protein